MAVTKLHLTDRPPTVLKGERSVAGSALDVATSRELVAQTKRRPWQGDTTVIHITQAHLTRGDVWNTLLKVLEEPPPYVHFHLYAPSTDSIPRTIKSRSHVTRENLPDPPPEDASRLIRLIEQGDALTIVREADRHTELQDARRATRGIWIYAIQKANLDAALLSEYYLGKLRSGASPRIVMKALLLELARRHRAQLREQA
jgi:DNA polymerase III delta prime subunit